VPNKLFGIVEGFYRRSYTFKQRLDLIDFISGLGLNAYIYGPKADPYHRKNWNFVYALTPLHKPNIREVIKKIDSIKELGVTNFSIFFDDIDVPLTYTSAQLQVQITNRLHEHLRSTLDKVTLSFCPTQYRGFKETEYIAHIGTSLSSEIDIFWTGKHVVSQEITESDINRITQILKRPVLIWDNIFANDYIPGRILRFPYRKRAPGIIEKIRGIVLNPMNNYSKSKPLIYTAAHFFKDPYNYDPKRAWRQAVKAMG
jgi:hyaluronoglucosaminidase